MTIKINESNSNNAPMKGTHIVKAIPVCRSHQLQPLVHKFATIVYQNPPHSGEVKDDKEMDCTTNVFVKFAVKEHEPSPRIYWKTSQSLWRHTTSVEASLIWSWVSKDGSKPPTKKSLKMISNVSDDYASESMPSKTTFIQTCAQGGWPAEKEVSKQANAILYVIDKVTRPYYKPHFLLGTKNGRMFNVPWMKTTSRWWPWLIIKLQWMLHLQSKECFDEHYASILLQS